MPGSPRLIVSSPSALFRVLGEDNDATRDAAGGSVQRLRESPRRPGRYVVTLTDGREFVVGVAALSDVGATSVGVTLTAGALELLAHESRLISLVDRALATLARGRRTRRELEIRLRRLESAPGLVEQALDRLVASGVLSDVDVARAEASARLRRGEAPLRVRRALQQKGISGTTAAEAVSAAVTEDGFDELTSCAAAAAKRQRALSTLPPNVARRRLVGFLQRRGYSGTAIRSALGILADSLRAG